MQNLPIPVWIKMGLNSLIDSSLPWNKYLELLGSGGVVDFTRVNMLYFIIVLYLEGRINIWIIFYWWIHSICPLVQWTFVPILVTFLLYAHSTDGCILYIHRCWLLSHISYILVMCSFFLQYLILDFSLLSCLTFTRV